MSRSCNGAGVGGAGSWPIRSGDRRRAGWTHRVPRTALAELCGAVSPPAGTSRVRQRRRAAQPVAPSRVDGVIDAAGRRRAPPGLSPMRSGASDALGVAGPALKSSRIVVVCRSARASLRLCGRFRAGRTVRAHPAGFRAGRGSAESSSPPFAATPAAAVADRLPFASFATWSRCPQALFRRLAPPAGLSPRRRGASPPPRMSQT